MNESGRHILLCAGIALLVLLSALVTWGTINGLLKDQQESDFSSCNVEAVNAVMVAPPRTVLSQSARRANICLCRTSP